MNILNVILFTIIALIPYKVDAQTEECTLAAVKSLLSGNWEKEGRLTTFNFENDSTGNWKTEKVISTAPLFIIYSESGKWYLGSIDLLGSGEPYPFEIITLNNKKLVIKDNTKNTLIKYKRK